MAHVFKPTYTKPVPAEAEIVTKKGERFARIKKDGKTVLAPLSEDGTKIVLESRIYHVRYKAQDGTWKRAKGYSDKDATQALGVRLERGVARGIENLDDPYEDHNRRSLAEHLAEFKAHLEAQNNSPEHVHKVVACCSLVFQGCGFKTIPDISASGVEEWLAAARKKSRVTTPEIPMAGTAGSYRDIGAAFGVSAKAVEKWKADGAPIQRNQENDLAAIAAWRRGRQTGRGGVSVQTSNHYLRSLKRFTRWLVKRERIGSDPLADLAALNTRVDRRHDRRALDPADFHALLNAAKRGPVVEGIDGPDRAMLYLLAGWTGFRRKELASLTRRSFQLEGNPPIVTVNAAYARNKRRDSIPLHPVVVAWFREWLESKPGLGADEPLFPLRNPGGSSWRKTGKMMKTDLKAAGLPYKDEAGLYADFHSNRHTFISSLGRAGVSTTMAQKLARHSTPTLTANVYTHLGLGDKADAIASLPAPEFTATFAVPNPFCPSANDDGTCDISGFPGYRVDAEGAVLSEWEGKKGGQSHRTGNWRRLNPGVDKLGYHRVVLYRDGKPFTRYVHRLVLEAFVGPCSDGKQCRHLDSDPRNNRLDNLCWGTPAENQADRFTAGTDGRSLLLKRVVRHAISTGLLSDKDLGTRNVDIRLQNSADNDTQTGTTMDGTPRTAFPEGSPEVVKISGFATSMDCCTQYARRDSNPQPSVPKTDALSN